MTHKEFFQRSFGDHLEILDTHQERRDTVYMAIKVKATGDVFAVVILIQWCNDKFNFGYKDIEESCGPYDTNCPERILDLLTPTDSEYALTWRQQCREGVQRKNSIRSKLKGLKVRDFIKTAHQLDCRGFGHVDTFQLLDKRRNMFRILIRNDLTGTFSPRGDVKITGFNRGILDFTKFNPVAAI